METTWLDRTIGWLSPERGLRRMQARVITQTLGYEGARTGRRTDNWRATSTSADTELSGAIQTLNNRARDLVRNNPYAARALDIKVSNTIGTGIVAEVPNRRLAAMWDAFVENADADGDCDLGGVQALHERTRSESGESLMMFVPTEMGPGMSVAMKLRVLEPDHLDSSRDGINAETGNPVRHGIERSKLGAIEAFWLLPVHPGEGHVTSLSGTRPWTSVRVPAADVIHTFRRLRAGQTRGVTEFAPVMLRMRALDDYDDAEVMRKKIEACLAAFVTTPQGEDGARLGPVTTDETGRIETLFPGMIEYLRAGEDVRFSEPKTSGGYADFERFGLRAISAGYGVPYELMTGDLSQVNYSSYRAGLVDFRRRIETDQWQLHVGQVCRRIWSRFRAEIDGTQKNVAKVVPDWTPPRFELIDPLKETQAELETVLAGFEPWDEIVRRRGWTAADVLDSIEKWQKELDKRGIVIKSDHRTSVSQPKEAPDAEAEENEDAQAA